MIKYLGLFVFFFLTLNAQAQSSNNLEATVDSIYKESLTNGQAYSYLTYLCKNIGARFSGTPKAEEAVDYTANCFKDIGCSSVMKQQCMVPNWNRGANERAAVIIDQKTTELQVTALGGSVGTPQGGLVADVIEITHFGQLEQIGKAEIEGKIVFYNRPMNPAFINTFAAYSSSVNYRWAGASKASEYGAIATLTRSLSLSQNDFPHTGSMAYLEGSPKIPAFAISTNNANFISSSLQEGKEVQGFLHSQAKTLEDTLSHNVIAEMKGSEHPDKIILIGGHLDSWDLGEGAHDDGAGSAQCIEAFRLLKAVGYTPKHTLRSVLFMNEENGLAGAKVYADSSQQQKLNHIYAIESDRGGFRPLGFDFDGDSLHIETIKSIAQPLLEKYGLYSFTEGGTGADISQIKSDDILLVGLKIDTQRYFDFHHAATDTLESVNYRELEMGAAALASLIVILDQLEGTY